MSDDQGAPVALGMQDVPAFDSDVFVAALRSEQAGETTYLEFAAAAWRAGVVRYEVDLSERTCTYYGIRGEEFTEHYAGVSLPEAVTGTR
jgi:uncharacterized protein YbcV (DUF1398 family)